MLSIFVYIVPAVLIRYLLLGRPMQSGAAVGLSLLLFFVSMVASIFLLKASGEMSGSAYNPSVPWIIIASVWGFFILRAGSGASDSPYSTVDSTLKKPKPASSADKAQKASPSKTEDAKTPTSNPIKKQKDKAPYKPKEIPMNSAHDDEKFYEQVATELQEGNTRQGLWLKAETKAGGDKEQARLLYVEWRVEQLTEAAVEGQKQTEAAEPQKPADEAAEKLEEEAQNYEEQQAEQIDSTREEDGEEDEDEIQKLIDKAIYTIKCHGYLVEPWNHESDIYAGWHVYKNQHRVRSVKYISEVIKFANNLPALPSCPKCNSIMMSIGTSLGKGVWKCSTCQHTATFD